MHGRIELTILALFAVAVGALLGYGAQWGLAWLLRDLIRMTLPPASLAPIAVALVTVNAMLVGFALPALLHLKNTPPARVLRTLGEPARDVYLAQGRQVTAPYGPDQDVWFRYRDERDLSAWFRLLPVLLPGVLGVVRLRLG